MKREFTKLMAALALLVFMTPSMVGWGQTKDDPTYKLTQVSSVSAGNKYVFVRDGHALSNSVSSDALQTVSSYSTTGLVGTESYVWTLETATGGFYFKNLSLSSNQYLNNASSTKVSFGSATSVWSFSFNNNVALISNTSNSNRFLGDAGKATPNHTYRAYATSNMNDYQHDFTVYILEEETTDPTITLSKTSLTGFHYNQGYGPSESQSFKVSGTNLGANITVSLGENSNYEMSEQDGEDWSTITSIELPAPDGTVGEKTLYVRMKSGLTGSEINGTITATSEGATSKSISLSGSVTPTYTLIYSAENGSITGASGATPVVSGTALVEGTTVALTAVPSSGYRFVSWSDGGTNATLSSTTDNPTTFTMGTANVTVTATFEVIPTHTVTFSVNGTTTTNVFVEGAPIVFPSDPGDINGMSFMGWITATISGTTNEAPSFVTSATMGTSDVTYYAVFAMATSDTPVEMVQTLQYDSWTYGGPTSDKTSYRLFGDGGYVESAAFNLSTLTQVNVYGGTYGGGDFNSLTIGDGTNTWKDVTVSGTSNTKKHEYTDGTGLTGVKKLRVTSNSGNGTGSGVRISKVEIYYTAIPYSYYCTTVPAALPPVITVAENPFVISTTATITCATPEATIKYSFDNENWENYSTALTITTATTIYAKALKGGDESTISSVEVTKNLAEPTVTIDASGITNTNVFNGTDAGSLSAIVTYNDNPIEGATVTWSGDNDEVATIDATTGVVTLVAAGSVTFTATYAGNSDYSEKTAIYNMTVTNVNPNDAGTRCNPYTVAEAKALMANWTQNTQSSSDVYVSGIVCSANNVSSGSQTYYISDDGTNNENSRIQVYKGKGVNGDNFTDNYYLEEGEQVIVKGKLYKYGTNLVDEINSGSILVLYAYFYDSDGDGVNDVYYCEKGIEGYGNSDGGYYLVASPFAEDPTTEMTTGDYDLYYFDEAQTQEWRNYEANNFSLTAGKGYLYANSTDVSINYNGEVPTTISTTLSKTENAEFEGMNLVGNPLGTKAYIGRSFYIMNSEGTELLVSPRNYIFPMEGVFVNAEEDGENLTFNDEAPVDNPGKGNLNIQVAQEVSSRGTTPAIDRAVVSFNGIDMLPKFQLNPNSTKLYIPQGNKDYAVVRSNAQGEMPVNFKAAQNGNYTISVEAENLDVNYLHLIDNKTGEDIDLLAIPSYSFEAKTTDYASRFRLVFNANNGSNENGNETFAYYNGSEWVINNMGDATLQVVDVMGRVLSSETVSGNATINLNQTPGVYMLRLINGDSVKVQKVVVR